MTWVCVIMGVTASGKTRTAVQLAKQYNAEIISADSVAIYKEYNIGSAKPTKAEQAGIVHHFIDDLSYQEGYDVARFQKEARDKIAQIQASGKNVIVVGGTGYYIKALLYDYRFTKEEVAPESFEAFSNEALHAQLMERDPKLAALYHPNNRKRIVRALHAAMLHQKPQAKRTENRKHEAVIDAHVFFLTGNPALINQRIEKRVDAMFEAGLENEVRALYDKDPTFFNWRSAQAIGYREFKEYFLGNQTREETIELIKRNTRRFSKRQRTWFRNQMEGTEIDIFNEDAIAVIGQFMESIK